jgi:hypothetical protein
MPLGSISPPDVPPIDIIVPPIEFEEEVIPPEGRVD